jgi:hypothetical protein
MKITEALVLTVVLISWQRSSGADATVGPEQGKRLTLALSEREPEWQTKHVVARANELVQRWVPKEGVSVRGSKRGAEPAPSPEVLVQVSDMGSPEKAADTLQASIRTDSIHFSRAEASLGDAAFIWDSYGPHGESGIRIRKGGVLIYVNGPTLDVTMRFAKHYLKDVESQLKK